MTTYYTTQNPVRIMFPNLAKAREVQKGKPPRFGCLVLIKKNSDEHKALKQIIIAAMEEKWGKAAALAGRCNPIKDCAVVDKMRDADPEKTTMFDKLDDLNDYVYFNASSQNAPGYVDADLNDLIDLSVFQSGCHVRVNINAWCWENSGDKGVSIGLNHVQFMSEGETLATGNAAARGSSGAKAVFNLGGAVADASGAAPDVDAIFG